LRRFPVAESLKSMFFKAEFFDNLAAACEAVYPPLRAKGKRTQKVFKLTKKTIAPGETLAITRRHSFQHMSARKYYPANIPMRFRSMGRPLDA
jgi:hypothetical protein